MANTQKKTMKPKDVVYPSSVSRHASVGVYNSMKSHFPVLLGQKVEGDMDRLTFSKADGLIRKALADRDKVKSTYFKIGLIGTDLVLRVKTHEKGAAGFFKGFDQKDAVLLHGCKHKAGAAAAQTEEIAFATHLVLAPGDLPAIVSEYYKVDRGYGIKLSVTVAGADRNSGVRARVVDLHEEFCEEYHRKAVKIVADLGVTLARLTVKSERSLQDHAAAAQAQLEALLAKDRIAKEFEARVKAMVASDANLKQHAKEWRIKGACTAVISTIKLTAAVARLVASHGTDVTAYKSIVSAGLSFCTLIKDFTKSEKQVAAELDKAIALYKKSANDLFAEVEAAYAQHSLGTSSNLGALQAALQTAGDAGAMVQDKITAGIRKLTGKSVAEAPETARKRYSVELGKLVEGLDAQFGKLAEATVTFKDSDLQKAVRAWPQLQSLKAACEDALQGFKAKHSYSLMAKVEIKKLGIKVDDATTLDKFKTAYQGLARLQPGLVMEGATPTATIGATVYRTYSAVSALVSAVEAAA